jgi:endoglucanase
MPLSKRLNPGKLGLCLLFGMLALSIRTVRAQDSTNPFFGYRGINISMNHHPKAEDLAKIKSWGANLIRLVLNTDPKTRTPAQYDGNGGNVFNADNKTLSPEYLARIDEVVAEAKQNGIKVILDMHTFPGHTDGLVWGDKQYGDELVEIWKDIAVHFKGSDTVLGFDPINEPNVLESPDPKKMALAKETYKKMSGGQWAYPPEWRNTANDFYQLITRIVTTINEIDPSRTTIVEGVGLLGNPVNYNWMEPVAGKNIVYSFHFYSPHSFSHNGVAGNPSTHASYSSAKEKAKLTDAVKPVIAFAKANHASFYVGEIGLSPYADGHGATEWLNDAIGIFEANQWSWTYWAYSFPGWSPEYALVNGKVTYTGSTERLQVLKAHWAANDSNQK